MVSAGRRRTITVPPVLAEPAVVAPNGTVLVI